jgi:hypothetical protein
MEKAHGILWIGGWMGQRTGLDNVEKEKSSSLPELKPPTLGHSDRGQSLCCMGYPGFLPRLYRIIR